MRTMEVKMAFHDVVKGKWRPRRAVSYRVCVLENQGTVKFMISRDVYERLGEPAFIRLGVGSGEHSGMVLVRGAQMKRDGTYKIGQQHPRGQVYFAVSASKVGLPSRTIPQTEVSFVETDEGLVVHLPK